MSKFSDCVLSAQKQGVLSKEEAEALIARYDEHLKAQRASGAADPEAGAKTALAAEKDAEAARRRDLAQRAVEARDAVAEKVSAYRGNDGKPDVFEGAMRLLEHFGFTGYPSLAGRGRAIVSLAHGEMAEVLRAFERNFYTGLRHDKPAARDLVREMLGEDSGSPTSKAMAQAVSKQFEALRARFNAAGGGIGQIEGGYIPQFHDPLALRKAGYDKWRAAILPRLDTARMKEPMTGGALSAERLEESLRAAYDRIVTSGWLDREPQGAPQGRGALAKQRADERFFAFKSADDWLSYDRAFGHGDPVKAIFQHVNSMARDIAALETLGPNPAATIEWLKQVIQSEHAKALAGKDSLFRLEGTNPRRRQEQGAVEAKKLGDLFAWVNGRAITSGATADFFSNVRNWLTSAQLGSAAITAAATDPAIERATRQALGMADKMLFGSNGKVFLDTFSHFMEQIPVAKHMSFVLDKFTGAPRAQALRAGLLMEDFLHVMGDEVRYAGTLGGNLWSRWLADRTVTLSGLNAITEARKAVFMGELQGWLADLSGKQFADLPQRLTSKLEGYGIGAKQWDALRATDLYRRYPAAAGQLRPKEVAGKDRELAERYVEFLLGESERAVPTGTLRSKAFVLGEGTRGEFGKELLQTFLQYRSFGLSLMTLQWEAMAHEVSLGGGGLRGGLRGASYTAQMFTLITLGGAATLQLKAIANGRDPQDIRTARFWQAAAATGGGFGILGDFLFADYSRYGQGFAQTASGPTAGLISDVLGFTLGNMAKAAQGKPTDIGRQAVALTGRYIPVVGSTWYTRLAFQRELLDQLQYQVDPQAEKRWRNMARNAMKERGQGYFWPPGATAPARAPQFTRP